jgi:hypothetical protein
MAVLSFILYVSTQDPKILWNLLCTSVGDQIKVKEVGRSYGMYGREDKCIQGFGGKIRRKETTWKVKI